MILFRFLFVVLCGFVVYVSPLQAGASSVGDSWQLAASGEHRSKTNAQRDKFRHPKETLSFFGVTPSSTVVEIWPGGGWYTEILAPLLKDKGVFYAAHFGANPKVSFFQKSRNRFEQKLQANPSVYSKVITTSLMPPSELSIAPAGSADAVLTFRNVHNWMKSGNEVQVFAAMFNALRPGGVMGVVEHRAKPGTSLADMIDSGYVTEGQVKRLAEQAGFTFVASSEVNANALDTAAHPKGVWTLPPSLRLGDERREHYLSIGESDRMTLKFIKPVK